MRLQRLFIALIAVGIAIGGIVGPGSHDRNGGSYSDSSEGVVNV